MITPPAGPTSAFGPNCPIEVTHPTMIQRWDLLTFLHWPYEPEFVQRLLPSGLTVETFDGQAWVGLVPFLMEVRGPAGPPLPWVSHFCETNVRTYVTGPDGTRGVWFLSLDAARLGAVVVARTAYRLPYFWSRMRLSHTSEPGGHEGEVYTYTTRRRRPGPRGAASRARIEVGAPFEAADLGEFDHYLSARWRLYSPRGADPRRTGMRYALAEHAPWRLHRAKVLDLDDDLVAAAGLPRPEGDPVVHWSPGTEVRISRPYRLRPS